MKPKAVVVGGDLNGLGVIRSLARKAVPTIIVDRDERNIAMRSRYGEKVVFGALDGDRLIADLRHLRSRLAENPVLILTQEKSVNTVLRHRDAVMENYRISLPTPEITEPLMHKASFQELAQKHGFGIPRAVSLRAARDLDAAKDLIYPCVLKPSVKRREYETRFAKAYKVANFAELERHFREISQFLPDMIAQEWIEGGDDCIYFCLQYRTPERAVASFVGQKVRSWPPHVGGTASCMPAGTHAQVLEALTDRFFVAVGFYGLCSMEFKHDRRRNQFLMIEPTVGRTDHQEEIATLNGVNIPYAAYCSEAGIEVEPASRSPSPRAAVWSDTVFDRWSRELQPESTATFPANSRIFDATWRLYDPLPGMVTKMGQLRDRLASLAQRLKRGMPQPDGSQSSTS